MSPPRALLAALVSAWALAGVLDAQERAAEFDHSHAAWTRVLDAHVREGGFDYAKLKQERSGLDAYLATLQAVTPAELAKWNEKQRFAFWINAYNAFCIQRVVDHYPLKSIRKLDGAFGINTAFDQGFIPMGAHDPAGKGDALSLNTIDQPIKQDSIDRHRRWKQSGASPWAA